MRTKTLLTAALLAAGVASSMAQSNVYSLNVVGYVNEVFLGAGKYSMVANPLNSTNNTLGGTLTLPVGSQVLKYDPGLGDYVTYTRVVFAPGWSPAAGATASLNPGEGIFVKTPAASGNITNTFVGEVLQGSLTNNYPVGYTFTANKVPDSGSITALGFTPPNGTQILKLDPVLQDFVTYTKVVFAPGWSPSIPTNNVGDGFFVKANVATSWVRNFTVQ